MLTERKVYGHVLRWTRFVFGELAKFNIHAMVVQVPTGMFQLREDNLSAVFADLDAADANADVPEWKRVAGITSSYAINLPANSIKTVRRELFGLLNWRVWHERYRVNYAFIIEALLVGESKLQFSYGRSKKRLPYLNKLTGTAARVRLEEALSRVFPSGENYSAYENEMIQRMRARTQAVPQSLAQGLDDDFKAYREVIERRQHEGDADLRERFKRTWRGNPFNG